MSNVDKCAEQIHGAVTATAQMLQPDWVYLEQWIHEILERALAEQREGIAEQRVERAEQQAAYYKQARRELLDRAERAEEWTRHYVKACVQYSAILDRVRQVLINADEFGDEIDPDDLRRALEGGES